MRRPEPFATTQGEARSTPYGTTVRALLQHLGGCKAIMHDTHPKPYCSTPEGCNRTTLGAAEGHGVTKSPTAERLNARQSTSQVQKRKNFHQILAH